MLQTDSNAALRNFSALVDFSNLVNSSLDLGFALNNILLTCFGKFHTTKGLIALINDDGVFKIKASKGIAAREINEFPEINLQNLKNNLLLEEYLKKNNFPICQQIKSSEGIKGLLILGQRLTKKDYEKDDLDFLNTILNVGATAIENTLAMDKLKIVNRDLDAKVNQLSSLFDLSKEFSGILQTEMVGKLLVYSLIGQMLVSKYSIITCVDNKIVFLENRFDEKKLRDALKDCTTGSFTKPITNVEVKELFPQLYELGVELAVPMQIKGETKGLILLGKRRTNIDYSKSDVEFVSSVGSLAIISIENARLFNETLEKQRLEKDLETARNIQQNLLPKKIPHFSNIQISAFNASARMVGGDYYDIVKLESNKVLVAVADVSGKGVPASLLMANLQAFLKSICKQKLPLDEATNLMNDLVAENTMLGSFITFFWCVIDNENKELTYVNAGHNPPLHIRNGEISKFKKGGMILGVLPTTIPYVSDTIKLESGDAIIMFTDGITEAMNVNGEEFSDERLEELSVKYYKESADDILNKIKISVQEFTQGAEQSDDITSVIVKVI
jgi:sigma-B regulation protein RsbU (phosphoserine phosphatase)